MSWSMHGLSQGKRGGWLISRSPALKGVQYEVGVDGRAGVCWDSLLVLAVCRALQSSAQPVDEPDGLAVRQPSHQFSCCGRVILFCVRGDAISRSATRQSIFQDTLERVLDIPNSPLKSLLKPASATTSSPRDHWCYREMGTLSSEFLLRVFFIWEQGHCLPLPTHVVMINHM